MIQLCAFADEADKSLAGQIAALQRNGIGYIELRGINGTNIADVTERDAQEYAAQLADAGIKVWSLGSPIGKIKISDYGKEHKDKLRHLCHLAQMFGTDKIRVFSFYEAYDARERVLAALRELVDIAAAEGITLYHENEKAIYGDTLARVKEVLENVKGLAAVYDPANFLEVGECAATALDALRPAIGYYHIKDVIADTHELVPAGLGDGRIDRLIAGMPTAGEWVLTLEPHLAVFDGYAQIDATEMKNRFHFTDNQSAFAAAADALKALLAANGYQKTEKGYEKQ